MPRINPDSNSELDSLAAEINRDHKAGEAAEKKSRKHFHRCGTKLLEAKALVGHGNWENWLRDNCPEVTERQAQRYMALAKSDVTSDLEEEWRRICGNDRRPQARSAQREEPQPADDPPEEVTLLTGNRIDEKDWNQLVTKAMEIFGTDSVKATVFEALRRATSD
jgi:Protein of unknown function (DUF3102)